MASNSKRQGRQSAESAAQTQLQVVQAATNLFADKGFDSTSLRDIAQQAQVTHGTLRHHFGSKLDVWKAVADRVLEQYQQSLMPAVMTANQAASPLHAFKNIVSAFISTSNKNPIYAKLLVQECTHNNPRSDYVKQHFLGIHILIEPLFLEAQKTNPKLEVFSNDSFFLALLSLTFFPLLLPEVTQLLSNKQDSTSIQNTEQLILNILLGDS